MEAAAGAGVSPPVPAAKLEEFRQAFNLFDKNKDGSITTSELGTAMRVLGLEPSEAEVRLLIAEADPDGNGNVELDAFVKIVSRKSQEAESPAACVEAFKVFDKDSNGFVTVAEFRHILSNIGDEPLADDVVDEMIKMADVDEAGQVSYEPFVYKILAPMP